MTTGRFATLISCIDGRIQMPLNEWIRKNYQVDYVDTVTEPGVDGLAGVPGRVLEIRQKAEISQKAHGSKLIVISGHFQCAANPGYRESHIPQIRRWVEEADSWGTGAEVVGVWVGEDWKVEPIVRDGAPKAA